MTISPLALTAQKTIEAAWLHGPSHHLASQAAFALESAQMLQSPETAAAELVALRFDLTGARMAMFETERENRRLLARVAELEALVRTADSRDEQAHLMDPLDHVLEHLADTAEPSPMAVLVARQNEQGPVYLATPCANCGHPYNWHVASACKFGNKTNRCGCVTFTPVRAQQGAAL